MRCDVDMEVACHPVIFRWKKGEQYPSPQRNVAGQCFDRLRILLFLLLYLSTQAAALASEKAVQPAATNWPTVGGDLYNTRYSTLTRVHTGNVSNLGAEWVSETFDEGGRSSVTPVVDDGVMFVSAGRKVYALDAVSGVRIWSYSTVPDTRTERSHETLPGLKSEPFRGPTAVPNSKGVAISPDMIFVGLVDGNVIAIRKKTGELAWMQQTGVSAPKPLQRISGAPVYVNGVVLVGLANGDANLRGRITALHGETGKILWQIFTIPGPGEAGNETWPAFNDTWRLGGGGVWTNAAVDPKLGLAYFTTGNPVPAFAGDWRPGDNLYTCSVLAIDIRTGKLKWHFQLVHHDVFEADAAVPPVLYDAQVDGSMYPAIAVLRADGYLFQLDRRSGKPLRRIEERAVPQSVSQKTSPTQPFPVGDESILMSCEDWKKEKIPSGFVLGCMWTPPVSPPPSEEPQNVLAPFPSARISPIAFSPVTGLFYAQAPSALMWPRRSQDPYQLTFEVPVVSPNSYRDLAAIDGRTGRIVWKRRLNIKARSSIDLTGGLLATAGGLVFRSSSDGNVEAYDAAKGGLLWNYQTGMVEGRGSPISYEVDGEQYLAVPMGPSIWGFKLGGKIPAKAAPEAAPREGEYTGTLTDTSIIEAISLKRASFASVNRYFIDEFAFNPTRARVAAGATVMFANNGKMTHEFVAADGSWGTGPLSPAEEAWIKFDKPGQHAYVCRIHPWTHGQIIVVPEQFTEIRDPLNGEQSLQSMRSFDVQAAMGKDHFAQHCSTCHGEASGQHAMAPDLIGHAFGRRWRGIAVGALLERLRTTMPPDKPGSLPDTTYLSIIAYILRANSMAQGYSAELTDDTKALSKMVIGDSGEHAGTR